MRTVHGHFIDLRRVVLFDIAKNANVVRLDKVDGHTLASETTRSTDAEMDSVILESNPASSVEIERNLSYLFEYNKIHDNRSIPKSLYTVHKK